MREDRYFDLYREEPIEVDREEADAEDPRRARGRYAVITYVRRCNEIVAIVLPPNGLYLHSPHSLLRLELLIVADRIMDDLLLGQEHPEPPTLH